jgi:hypothetical protein
MFHHQLLYKSIDLFIHVCQPLALLLIYHTVFCTSANCCNDVVDCLHMFVELLQAWCLQKDNTKSSVDLASSLLTTDNT